MTITKRGKHARKRKFPGIKGKRPDRKAIKRAEAIERNARKVSA